MAAREARGNPILPYEAAQRAAELVGEKSESLILVHLFDEIEPILNETDGALARKLKLGRAKKGVGEEFLPPAFRRRFRIAFAKCAIFIFLSCPALN